MLMYIHYYMFTHIYGTLYGKNICQQKPICSSKFGMSQKQERLKIPLHVWEFHCKVLGWVWSKRKIKTLVLKTTHPCAMLKLSLAYHSRWSYLSVCRGAIWDVHTSLNLAIVTTKKAKEVVCIKHHPNTMYHLHAYISHILYSIQYLDI